MAVIVSKITSKRQVTVPKDVCDNLGLAPGDEIAWVVTRTGIRIQRGGRGPRFARWRGHLKHLEGTDVDGLIDEMRGR